MGGNKVQFTTPLKGICSNSLPGVGIIGYIRIPVNINSEPNYISVDVQENKIREFARIKEVPIKKIFVDVGKSGAEVNDRPELIKALQSLNKGDFFIVHSLYIFSTNMEFGSPLVYPIVRCGVVFISASEKLDSNIKGWKMAFNFYFGIYDTEIDNYII